MASVMQFGEVLDAADKLSPDEQQELISILQRRLVETARGQLLADIEESRREFESGKCRVATPAEIMREIME